MADMKPIILWCHPRSISTAFERAFLELPDQYKCYHEPLSYSFYFGPNRISRRFVSHQIPNDWRSTISKTIHSIFNAGTSRRIFIKDMAQHVVSPDSEQILATNEFFDLVINTFLIRSPVMAVPSFYRMCVGKEGEVTGFHYYDPNEAGYREQRILFDHLRRLGHVCIVVDSADLIENPEGIMRAYCRCIGAEFRQEMIEWEARPIKEFEDWPGFHFDAENSTGFGKNMKNKEAILQLPDEAKECIETNMPHYEYMREFKLHPAVSDKCLVS